MTKTEIRNLRQGEALKSIVDNNDVGTIKCVTSFGKSWVMYNWFYSLLERGKIHIGEPIWILSYTTEQGKNLLDECISYAKVKNKHPEIDFHLSFYCYSGMPVERHKDNLPRVCVYDEISSLLF